MIDKDTKEALRILARLFHFDGHMSQMDAYKLKQQGSKLAKKLAPDIWEAEKKAFKEWEREAY